MKITIRRMIVSIAALIFIMAFSCAVSNAETLNIDNIEEGDCIFMGNNNSSGYTGTPQWTVLNVDENNMSALVVSEYLWTGDGNDEDANVTFNNDVSDGNQWSGSEAQKWCQAFYRDVLNSSKIIKRTKKTDKVYKSEDGLKYGKTSIDDYVFFLSAKEIETYLESSSYRDQKRAYRHNGISSDWNGETWWTRSPFLGYYSFPDDDNTEETGFVFSDGELFGGFVDNTCCMRPAFTIDLSNGIRAKKNDYGAWEVYGYKRGEQYNEYAESLSSEGTEYGQNIVYVKPIDNKKAWVEIFFYRLTGTDGLVKAYYSTNNTASFDDPESGLSGKLTFKGEKLSLDLDEVKDFYFDMDLSEFVNGLHHEYILKQGESEPWGFTLKRDNNRFLHSSGNGGGFKDITKHSLSDSFKKKLTLNSSTDDKDALDKYMDEAEWHGSCHGISTTMALVYTGRLAVSAMDSKATSYYKMSPPSDSTKNVLNYIEYYQLSQKLTSEFQQVISAKCAENYSSSFAKLWRKNVPLSDMKAVFNALYEEWEEEGIALFGYNYMTKKKNKETGQMEDKETGHTIIVTNVEYNDGYYIFTFYDMNANDKFVTLTVNKEMNQFSFVDGNGKRHDTTNYTQLKAFDLDKIQTVFGNKLRSSSRKSSSTGVKMHSMTDHTYITVPDHVPFELTTDDGEWLSFDGNDYDGNIDVYDIIIPDEDALEEDAGGNLIFETEHVDAVDVAVQSDEFEIEMKTDGRFQSVGGEGLSTINMKSDGNIMLDGENYHFKAYFVPNDPEDNMVSVSGKANGETDLSPADKSVAVKGENTLTDIQCKRFTEDFVEEIPVEETAKEFIVGSEHVHTYGAWKVTKKATEISAGTKIRTCSVCGDQMTKSIARKKPTLKAVKIKKVKAGKKSATVKWKKIAKKDLKKIKKVQIRYSTDKKFKKGVKTTYASAKKTSKYIKTLKKGKKYYVKIRAYTKSGKTVHVSKWSAVKAVKVK